MADAPEAVDSSDDAFDTVSALGSSRAKYIWTAVSAVVIATGIGYFTRPDTERIVKRVVEPLSQKIEDISKRLGGVEEVTKSSPGGSGLPAMESVEVVGAAEVKYNGHAFTSPHGRKVYFFRGDLGEKIKGIFARISIEKLNKGRIPDNRLMQAYNWMASKTADLDRGEGIATQTGYIRHEAVEAYENVLGNELENFDLRGPAYVKR